MVLPFCIRVTISTSTNTIPSLLLWCTPMEIPRPSPGPHHLSHVSICSPSRVHYGRSALHTLWTTFFGPSCSIKIRFTKQASWRMQGYSFDLSLSFMARWINFTPSLPKGKHLKSVKRFPFLHQ